MHLYPMQMPILTSLRSWIHRKNESRNSRLYERHQAIARQGRCLSARVVRAFSRKQLPDRAFLVSLRLEIELEDAYRISLPTKTLVRLDPSRLEGRTIRFLYLPGDYSQVVLL
jgi:hypothetical protein